MCELSISNPKVYDTLDLCISATVGTYVEGSKGMFCAVRGILLAHCFFANLDRGTNLCKPLDPTL